MIEVGRGRRSAGDVVAKRIVQARDVDRLIGKFLKLTKSYLLKLAIKRE